ncbi:MAG TPA: hypothetical protein VIL66_10410 [Bacillota bacterium]
MRGRQFYFLCLTAILLTTAFLSLPSIEAGWELTDYFPLGSKIVQIIADAAFDRDEQVEYLCLYSLQGRLGVMLLDQTPQGYSLVFHKTLGVGNPETEGRVAFADTAYTYRILQAADLDRDGILEFWTLFHPEKSDKVEMTLYKFKNHSYYQVFSVDGQYDLQFIDYEGELVIHGVFLPSGEEKGLLEIKSAVWDFMRDGLEVGEERYQISRQDYLSYARSRWRPQFFTSDGGEKVITYRWGNALNKLEEIPGERAIASLLPTNTLSIVEIISDPALDRDVEEEFVVTYLVPDAKDTRKVLMKAALINWDFEGCQYSMTPLPFEAYGLARDPEGNFYRTSYIIPGNGLNHLAFLGNGERLSSLKLTILNNTGLFFEKAAEFNGSYHLQFFEDYTREGLSYRVVTADVEPNGRIKVKTWVALPEKTYHGLGGFKVVEEEVCSSRQYKQAFYRVEEPVWTSNGYEYFLLRTNHRRADVFSSTIPQRDFQGNLADYIFKYMTPLRIHHWSLQDLDQDGLQEALVLIRIDEDIWTWPPKYRLAMLTKDDQLQLKGIGHYPLQIGDGNPVSGVYQADITGDGRNELLILTREYHKEQKRNQVFLEIITKDQVSWVKAHNSDISYDDLRLFQINGEFWLFGFVNDPNYKERVVYKFVWKDGRFSYKSKEKVVNFLSFLETLPEGKVSVFSESFRIFPAPPGRN